VEIPNYELEDWLSVLKPYQKNIVSQLVSEYGEEKTIEKWLTASGPTGTVKFGGDGNMKPFLDKYKNEINKFICGHPDYNNERTQLGEENETIKTIIVSSISSLIGSKLGVAAAVLAPAIVLSLYIAGKMGVKAYCSGILFE
jgi:hypothetical protein